MNRFILSVAAAFVALCVALPALGGSPGKGAKKPAVTWIRIEQGQFQVEQQLGALTSCTYRLCDEGKSAEFIYENRVRVAATKSGKGDMLVTLYIAKTEIKDLTRDLIVAAIEDATQQCYERISDD